jgi:hypothetical protein
MANSPSTPAIEALAADIGENIYIDVAKWHLYLAEAHLHTPLAEQVYPLLLEDQLSRPKVEQILQNLAVSLGDGKQNLSLLDLIPNSGISRLMTLLEDYQQSL